VLPFRTDARRMSDEQGIADHMLTAVVSRYPLPSRHPVRRNIHISGYCPRYPRLVCVPISRQAWLSPLDPAIFVHVTCHLTGGC